MASKKKKSENALSYLQMPLPEGRKYYKMTKRSWSGLNYRQVIDSGALSMERNISTKEAPYLVPSEEFVIPNIVKNNKTKEDVDYSKPISMFGIGDYLVVLYRKSGNDKVIYIDFLENTNGSSVLTVTRTGVVNTNNIYGDMERSIVQFNAYDTVSNVNTGEYIRKLVIFPDAVSLYLDVEEIGKINSDNIDSLSVSKMYYSTDGSYKNDYVKIEYVQSGNSYTRKVVPIMSDEQGKFICEAITEAPLNLKYATVHQSRVFALSDDRIYASANNSYTRYLPTVGKEGESKEPWISTAQSNTKADSKFTGITTFLNHVICFKQGYMHEIYNDNNPFRVQDIYAEGAIDNRTIQDVDGQLIFVSEDGVKIYTGSNPRIIDYNLKISGYKYAVSGNDGRFYYLYWEAPAGKKGFFTYDIMTEQWSEQIPPDKYVINFAKTNDGMYMFCGDGKIYQIDSNKHDHIWAFETDLITNETVDIKHVKKIQMFADMNEGSSLRVYLLYDDEKFNDKDEEFKQKHLVYEGAGEGRKAIRFKTRMTAHYGFKLHVSGSGYIRLYEAEIAVENGGELFV